MLKTVYPCHLFSTGLISSFVVCRCILLWSRLSFSKVTKPSQVILSCELADRSLYTLLSRCHEVSSRLVERRGKLMYFYMSKGWWKTMVFMYPNSNIPHQSSEFGAGHKA